jgi:hypothetical protein
MPGDNFFTAENVVALVLAIIVVIIFTIPVILLFLSENTNAELATPDTTIVYSLVANRLNASPIDTPNSFFTNAPPFQISSAPKTRSRSRSTLIIPSPFHGSPPTGVTQTPRPILNANNLNFNDNSKKSTKIKKHRRSSKA